MADILKGYQGRHVDQQSVAVSSGTALITVQFQFDVIINELSVALDTTDTGAIVQIYRNCVSPGQNCGQSQVAYSDTDMSWRLLMANEPLVAYWTGITTATRATLGIVGLRFDQGYGVSYWLQTGARSNG